MQHNAAGHGNQSQHLAKTGGGAAGWRKAVPAGKAAAEQAAHVQRIRGHQVQEGQAGLHPHHAAQQVCGSDERLAEQADVAPCAQKGGCQNHGRGGVGNRTGKCDSELTRVLVGFFLALGIGVGKQSANGQKENCAQPKAKPGCHQQARRFPYNHRRCEYQEQANAAQDSVRGAENQAHDRQQREKGVDAYLNTHPSAQWD